MRMAACLVLLLAASGAAASTDASAKGAAAHGGAVDVRVADDRGAPVADAVVSVRPRAGSAAPEAAAARRTIDQKNLAFVPSLEVFRPGDEVVFRNSDATRHHVYSFSPAAQFEFVLAPRESSPPLRLERTGVVAVGCNIHDSMIAWLYVSDAPWIARTGADGRARFDGLPPGAYEVRAWQPRLKPGRAEPSRAVAVAADGTASVSFALPLLPPPRLGHGHVQY
jgi:plastocyanin